MTPSMPAPAWKPELVEDVGIVTKKLREYTNGARAFAVYKCGTAVFSDTAAKRPDEDYDATLLAVGHRAPDFKVVPMRDGNYLVRFSGPVCGLVLQDFFSEHVAEIREKSKRDGLLPGEQVVDAGKMSAPVEHYYVGLFARAKLYRDIEEKLIVDRFVP
jgi:hypothetical protein